MFDLLSNLKYGMKLLEPRQLYAGISVYHDGDISMSAGLATLSEIRRLESESFSDTERAFYSYTPEKDVFSLLRDSLHRAIEFYEEMLKRQRESLSSLSPPHRSFSVNDWGLLSTMMESIEILECLVQNLKYKIHEIDELEQGDTETLTWTCKQFIKNLKESGLLSLYRTTPEGATP